MGRLSHYNDPKRLSEFINRFWDAITLIEDRREAITFLKDLLTPTEVRMLAKRLQIADMLSKGYKYEAIRNYARVTVQTISSVNNRLSFGNDGLVQILKKLEKIDQKRQDRLEGKIGLLDQPRGIGRTLSNVAAEEVLKIVHHHRKENSITKVSSITPEK
ncbi:MAG: YerC/YecD family TrpR-related protein [Candidatus Daviesbacteria bacterium]